MVVGFFISFVLRTGKYSEFNELNGFCFTASFGFKQSILKLIYLQSFTLIDMHILKDTYFFVYV